MTCQIEAKVLARSKCAHSVPELVTFQLRYPRIIHAELMTHRAFSRNARSSRAMPVERMLAEVRENPFIPRHWGANQKGMQAGEECNNQVFITRDPEEYARGESGCGGVRVPREDAWLHQRDCAVAFAMGFTDAGYHKQLCNRLIEPFTHIDVVLTTTDLSNWFALRDHDAAEPHIRDLAREMRRALDAHGPAKWLKYGEWHLPYVTGSDRDNWSPEQCIKLSVARCARVSYTPYVDRNACWSEETQSHDALVAARPLHASPCEHQATPDRLVYRGAVPWEHPEQGGNLGPGWRQYRKTLAGERA